MAHFDRIVVVIGTHRCGTSLLAQVLSRLNVDLGDDLIGPNEFNKDGHWENPEIVRLQERLLKRLRRQWYWQGGSVPLPAGWLERPETRRCEEQLAAVLASQHPKAPRPWGFKDPRTVRLLPLWQRIFRRLGLTPSYVFALRAPADVAASLFRRDALPRYAGAMLWLSAMHEAASYANSALVVDYDAWFDSRAPELVRRLARDLRLQADAATIEGALAPVRTELRHAATGDEAIPSPPLRVADEMYRAIRSSPTIAAAPPAFWHRVTEYGHYAEVFTSWARRYEERLSAHERLRSSP